VRKQMRGPHSLHTVESGDHSLRITRRHTKETGVTQEDSDRSALEAIRSFVEGVLATHSGSVPLT
jgi:hypothetical protein